MKMRKLLYGTIDKDEVFLLEMENDNNVKVSIVTFGAVINVINVPDRLGKIANVVLAYESLLDYQNDTFYTGALIGRFAGRINKGEFKIFEKVYSLVKNEVGKDNHLHGGIAGFNKKVFHVQDFLCGKDTISAQLFSKSVDMEEGYPGNLDVRVNYELNNQNELIIRYEAQTDKATHVNLTNHSYFNLSGLNMSSMQHEVLINADNYLVTDSNYIPTGEIRAVKNTLYDFSNQRPIEEASGGQLPKGGYNECYVLNKGRDKNPIAAILVDRASGREMQVSTSYPGLLFYTGDYLEGNFSTRQGVCFEAQFFPDTPNRMEFPSTLLLPQERFQHETRFKFSW